MQQQIKLELLNEWGKKGELLTIFGCECCNKQIPFYKQTPFIDEIILNWVKDHKLCYKCGRGIIKKKDKIPRINLLLEMYESKE
jgi:hypothetical protein